MRSAGITLAAALLSVAAPGVAQDEDEATMTGTGRARTRYWMAPKGKWRAKATRTTLADDREVHDEVEVKVVAVDPPEPPAPRGPFFRAVLDGSAALVPYHADVELSANGRAAQFNDEGHAWAAALGARAEVGYSFAKRGLTVVPRFGFALARLLPLDRRRTIAGFETKWVLDMLWWSVAGGVEFRAPKGSLGGFTELGIAGVTADGTGVAPVGLQTPHVSNHGGVFARLGLSLRFPAGSPCAGGVIGALEGLVLAIPGEDVSTSAFRTTLGVFAEWDGSER